MAVTNGVDAGFILNLLKVFYEDGVENLMFRNDPLLKEIKKERVEGKQAHFAALYGRGGAVAGSFIAAEAQASKNTKSAEFQVVPGKLFSVYTVSAIELAAAKTLKGAYMPIAAAKMFAASEAFRKTMAAVLYGSGYGELCVLKIDSTPGGSENFMVPSTAKDIVIPESAAIKLDVGSQIQIKASVTAQESTTTLAEVVAIGTTTSSGTTITVMPSSSFTPISTSTSAAIYKVISLSGSMNGTEALLPVGLAGWLPIMYARSGESWIKADGTGYINQSFMGVVRAVSPDRLAGAFYQERSDTAKKSDTIEQLMRMCRAHGSLCDMIVMNDKDWQGVAKETQLTNSFWTKTVDTPKGKKTANLGFNDMRFNFSTNWIDKVYDTPYCPEGVFYVLSSDVVKFWSYYNAATLDDGVAGNEPGKPNPTNESEVAQKPYALLIDDYITVDKGTDGIDGPTCRVTLNLAGSFAVKNPANCGVGLFFETGSGTGVSYQPEFLAAPTYKHWK